MGSSKKSGLGAGVDRELGGEGGAGGGGGVFTFSALRH